MKSLKNKIGMQVFVIYTRYLIGGTFVFASLIKIKGQRFTTTSGAAEPIYSALHFFETLYQSGFYWKFIGMSQLVAGFLLMTQRYSKLGALINLPILVNILAITSSYYFANTPIIVSLMLLATIFLITWEWDELKIIINLPYKAMPPSQFERLKIWEIIGLILFLFTFIYRCFVDQYNLFFWMGTCLLVGVLGLMLGLRQLKNNTVHR